MRLSRAGSSRVGQRCKYLSIVAPHITRKSTHQLRLQPLGGASCAAPELFCATLHACGGRISSPPDAAALVLHMVHVRGAHARARIAIRRVFGCSISGGPIMELLLEEARTLQIWRKIKRALQAREFIIVSTNSETNWPQERPAANGLAQHEASAISSTVQQEDKEKRGI